MDLRPAPFRAYARLIKIAAVLTLVAPAVAAAQTHVSSEAGLAAALQDPATTSIVFDNSITLSAGDLPVVNTNIVIDGNGFALSGNNQFRGLVVGFEAGAGLPVNVTIQNLTIQNTTAIGGAGGSGVAAGGGGAGLGGALYISSTATVTVSNVNLLSNVAQGGAGGVAGGAVNSGTGGGGGLGGAGGSGGPVAGGGSGGGGGFGSGAAGGDADKPGAAGILTGSTGGGAATAGAGGANGGGGGGGLSGANDPGAGGGVAGSAAGGRIAGDGGFGGGGGGADTGIGIAGNGGFGGGGGGGAINSGGAGGYGGGAGGSVAALTSVFAGGANNGTANGGGGAGLGGAIFMESTGQLIVSGSFTVNGNTVSGGLAGPGASAGGGFGSGIFLQGSGVLTIAPPIGTTTTIGDVIADESAGGGAGQWGLLKTGGGTLVLSGANQYSGGTTISAGTLSVSSDANMGTGGALGMDPGTTLAITANSTFARGLAMIGDDTVSVSAGKSATWTGTLFDNDAPSSLHVAGGGTLELASTANSYSGGTLVTGGSRVLVSSDGALGLAGSGIALGDAASGGTLAIASTSFASNRPLQLGASGGTIETVGSTTNATLTGNISGGGGLVKDGSGTLMISGANTYGGATGVNAGTLRAGAADVFGSSPSLSIAPGGSVDLNGFNQSVNTLAGGGSIGLNGGAALTLGASNASSAFGGSISGNGGLVKTGNGTLSLSGASTFSGGIAVNGGALTTASASTLGTGGVRLSNGTLFAPGGTAAYTNPLFLGGQPVLNVSGGQSITWSGQIGDNGTAGTLHLAGGGSLTLSNASNQYSGGTIVGGGSTLIVSSDGALGSSSGGLTLGDGSGAGVMAFGGSTQFTTGRGITIGSTAAQFDTAAASNVSLNGSIGGSGALIKTGAGTLTLGGANDYSGGTLISGGTLVGNTTSLRGTIVNNAALTFDQGIDGSFSGTMTGTGSVTKLGAGSMTITGANLFGGSTTIGQGTLLLDGALGGNVNVGAAGTLRGAGVIAGSVNVDGSIFVPAPGSSLSTFNSLHGLRLSTAASTAPDQSPSLIINGDLTTTPGSTFGVTVAPGAAPPIIVNGRANLVGTHVNVDINDPNPARYASYIAMTAANGLTMSGSDASNPSSTIVPVLSANANTLFVTMLNFAIPLAPVATAPNAIATANAIDAIKLGSTGDLGAVIREVTALDDAHLNGALSSLSGEIHASEQRLTIQDSQSITDMIRTELSEFEHDAEDTPGYASRARQPHVWYQVTGEHATFRSGAFSGATANVGGGAGGVDFMPTSRWSIGGGGSLSLGGMALTDISGSSQMTAPRAFGYSGYAFGPFHVHGGGSAARSSYNTTRQIAFAAVATTADGESAPLTNGINRTADADQTGVTRDAWSEIQDTTKFRSWTLDSKLGLRAAHYSRNAFSETGANAVSLDGSSDALETRESDINIHLFRRSGAWRPRVLLDFRRQIGDQAPTADVQFAGRADSQFVVNGLPVPRNAFQGLFGLTMRTQSGLEMTVEYETEQAPDEAHNAIHFRMRFR